MKQAPLTLMKQGTIFLIALLGAAVVSVQNARATTITVMNTNDSGAGSLRQALSDANDGDTINFSVPAPATITLTTGQLLVSRNLTITGPGADQLSVDGNAASRVFLIGTGNTVTISGLTIMNGNVGSDFGGGIYNDHATLTVTNSTISGNSASYGGGGILNNGVNSGSATLTVTNSTISGNSAVSGGGGILNHGALGSATLTVTNSTISGNSATSGSGIYNSGALGSATLSVTNSTISGNSTTGGGGGVTNYGFAGSATLTVTNSTISGNSAGFIGGGIVNVLATLEIGDTILKTGASGENIANSFGTVTSLGYNLSNDDGGGFLTATGDQINTDPLLGPLQDNGGPTFTHALLVGSPAIDLGDPNFTPPPNYDQRGPGYPRVVNGRIDIGSFEVQSSPPCPQPQGYWKNNPEAWPVESLTLGSQTYTKEELLTILQTPIATGARADASLILAHQLIAAKLNIENGADDPAPVPATIADADAVLSLYPGRLPYTVRTNSTDGQRMVNDASVLDNYNNGALTPSCTP